MHLNSVVGNALAISLLKRTYSSYTPVAYLITGASGCGKSMVARAILQDLRKDQPQVFLDASKAQAFLDQEDAEETKGVVWDHAEKLGEATDVVCHLLDKSAKLGMLHVFVASTSQEVPFPIRARTLEIHLGPLNDADMKGLVQHWIGETGQTHESSGIHAIVSKAGGIPGVARTLVTALSGEPVTLDSVKLVNTLPDMVEQLWGLLAHQGEPWALAYSIQQAYPFAEVVDAMFQSYVASFLNRTEIATSFNHYKKVSQCFLKWKQVPNLPGEAIYLFIRELMDCQLPDEVVVSMAPATPAAPLSPMVPYSQMKAFVARAKVSGEIK